MVWFSAVSIIKIEIFTEIERDQKSNIGISNLDMAVGKW